MDQERFKEIAASRVKVDKEANDFVRGIVDENARLAAEVEQAKEACGFAQAERDKFRAEAEKLQAFKSWCHGYLDNLGVPHHPPGKHGAEGCRIGDRMDWLVAALKAKLPSDKPAELELICPVCKKPLHVRKVGGTYRVCHWGGVAGDCRVSGPLQMMHESAVAGWFTLTGGNHGPVTVEAAGVQESVAEPKLSPCLHCGGTRFSFVDCDGLVINPGRTQCVHCTGCLAAGPQGHDHAEAILLHNQLSPDLTRLGELCRDINASYALAGKPLTEFRAVVNKLFPTVTQ